jgi:hypothetical protein
VTAKGSGLVIGDYQNRDLIVISSGANQPPVPYETLAVDVLSLNGFRWRSELDCAASSSAGSSTAEINATILDAASPLAAGQTGTVAVFNSSQAWKAINDSLNSPGNGSTTIVELDNQTTYNALVVDMPAGAQLDGGGTAPARRVLVSMELDGDIDTTTANFGAYIDAAVAEMVPASLPSGQASPLGFINFKDGGNLGADVWGSNDAAINGPLVQATVTTRADVVDFPDAGDVTARVDMSAHLAALEGAPGMSVAKWVYVHDSSTQIIFCLHDNAADNDLTAYLDNNTVQFQARQNNGATVLFNDTTAPGTAPTGSWVHVAAYFDNVTGWALTLNGTVAISGSDLVEVDDIMQNGAANATLWLGNWPRSPALPFKGAMDDAIFTIGAITAPTAVDFAIRDVYRRRVHTFPGQSNQINRATATAQDVVPPFVDAVSKQWRYDTEALGALTVPLAHVDPQAGDMSPQMGHLRQFVDGLLYKEELLAVPVSQGATSFTGNHWNPGDTLYTNAKTRHNAAMALNALNTFDVLHWQLGESDALAGMTQLAFETAFNNTLADIENTWTGYSTSTTQVILTQIGGPLSNTPARDLIIAATVDVANAAANRTALATSGYANVSDMDDDVHWGRVAANKIATAGAKAAGGELAYTAGLTGPGTEQSGAFDITLALRFEPNATPVAGNFTATECAVTAVATVSPTEYTITITPDSGSGTLDVQLNAAALEDIYGEPVDASNTYQVAYATTYSSNISGPATEQVGPFDVTLDLQYAPTTTPVAGNFTATECAVTTVATVSPTEYTITVTPDASATGTLTLQLDAGSLEDAEGRQVQASNVYSVAYDTTTPVETGQGVALSTRRNLTRGTLSQSLTLYASSSTGGPRTGLAYNTPNLSAYYRTGATGSPVEIPLVELADAQDEYTAGGFAEVDATNMPGVYRLDLPDAAIAAGEFVAVVVRGAADMNTIAQEVPIVSVDAQDAEAFGLNKLANVGAEVTSFVMPEAYAAAGDPASLAQLSYLMSQLLTQFGIVGATTEIKGLDKTTTVAVLTHDSATDATNASRTA